MEDGSARAQSLLHGRSSVLLLPLEGEVWLSSEAFRSGGVKEATYDRRLFVDLPGKDMVAFSSFSAFRVGAKQFCWA